MNIWVPEFGEPVCSRDPLFNGSRYATYADHSYIRELPHGESVAYDSRGWPLSVRLTGRHLFPTAHDAAAALAAAGHGPAVCREGV